MTSPAPEVLPSLHDHAARILGLLYCVEAAAALIVVGLYKAHAYDWTLLSTKSGVAIIGGVVGLIASGCLLVRQTQASGSRRRAALALASTTNLLTGLATFLLVEATVRIARRDTSGGIVVGGVAVRPTWPELAAKSREVLTGVAPWGTWDTSFFIYDRELGWTVGPNRQTPDGLYFSSAEGIRCAGPNMRMADQAARFRVALIGDSNAFSFEVPYQDSWGYHLQQLLGNDVQILNFGVDGYGIDQIYLRFQRDVRPWHPQVVVIGFIGHDLLRTMAVYPLVSFEWPGYAVKPRFVINQGKLELLNLPLPTPTDVVGTTRIDQLPFIDYDFGYGTTDWSWRFDHSPLILRFLTSAFPRWPVPDPRVSDESITDLNARLLAKIIESAAESGAATLVVDMSTGESPLVRPMLSRAGTSALHVTGCLTGIPPDHWTVPSRHHYTGRANKAIAQCTAPAVELALKEAEERAGARTSAGRSER